MTARQAHGFVNEEVVCHREGYTPWEIYEQKYPHHRDASGAYTSKWDAVDEASPGTNLHGLPIQIKTIKKGKAIELGDIFRNSRIGEDFRLVVEFYESVDPISNRPNIVESHSVDVDYSKWRELFTFDQYSEWADWIRNRVSNSYSYDTIWKSETRTRKAQWGPERIVQPRFKRDHKKQRRIQCAVSNSKFGHFIKQILKKEE